jgi:hypothetical protein
MKENSRKKATTSPANSGPLNRAGLHQQISKKAYELFVKRGYQHGHDREDWLEAERIVCSQLEPVSELGPKETPQRTTRIVAVSRPTTRR